MTKLHPTDQSHSHYELGEHKYKQISEFIHARHSKGRYKNFIIPTRERRLYISHLHEFSFYLETAEGVLFQREAIIRYSKATTTFESDIAPL